MAKSSQLTADDILAAIRRANPKYPLLTELVLTDVDRDRGNGDLRKRRIDGLLIGPRGQRTAIEVKVSRQDFLRETEAKRRPWIRCSHRFVYAAPKGLLRANEIPKGIGLWEVSLTAKAKTGFVSIYELTVAKRCIINKNPDPVPDQLFAALAYRLDNPRRRRR